LDENEGDYYYVSHKVQYPFVEISKIKEKDKGKENQALIPHQKRERKKSLKYDERSRSKSHSRVAQMWL